MRKALFVGMILTFLSGSCSANPKEKRGDDKEGVAKIVVSSPAFSNGGKIPRKYTCEGENIAPPLKWSGVPKGTKSLALIVDDPDAPDPAHPKMVWVHWVVYDIPPSITSLPEGGKLPAGAKSGTNDFKTTVYGGPCPPIGRHRYFFKVYALDKVLGDLGHPTKAQLLDAIKGHIIGKGELIGTYQKGDK